MAHDRFCLWMANKENYAILDVETTGLDDAEIVEIAVVGLNEEVLFHSLIRPEREIPAEATVIHGITDEMVAVAPQWKEVWSKVRGTFVDRTALIFNAGFDSGIIHTACRGKGVPAGIINNECVMETYARYARSNNSYHRDFSWIGLQDACISEGITISKIHVHLRTF
jgi:DNA polymerase-3 subunit epsilon